MDFGVLSEPAAGRTVQSRTAQLLGLDPTLRRRGSLLPVGVDANGEAVAAWPEWSVGLAQALVTPGHVAGGGDWSPKDATDMALAISGGGGVSGILGAAPKGALAMGAALPGKAPRSFFDLDYFGAPVKILRNGSRREVDAFIGKTKYKAARRVVDPDTGDEYIWDAGDPALHKMVAEALGIRFDPDKSDTLFKD